MGKIILLNTPIGNLGDLTPRVLEALKVGTVFAVEDTRVFKELLNHLGVSLHGKRVFALHDQSDDKQMDKMVELAQMDDLYVTSDAGSPIISDPAYPLVLAATEKGIAVESYSGVSSPVMALGAFGSASHTISLSWLSSKGVREKVQGVSRDEWRDSYLF